MRKHLNQRYGAGRETNKAVMDPSTQLHLAKPQVARIPWRPLTRQSLLHLPRTVDLRVFRQKKRQHDSRMEIKEEALKNRRLSVNDEALREQGRATSPCPEIVIWGNKGCTSNLNAPAD